MKSGREPWIQGSNHRLPWYTLLPTLMLAGILSMGVIVPQRGALAAKPSSLILIAQIPPELPSAISSVLKQDLSQRTGISSEQLQVTQASRNTWHNGCLGLAKPNEFCTQVMVNGWRVVLSNSNQSWVYHTDETGQAYRLETSNQPPSRLSSIWSLFDKQKGVKPDRLSQADLPPSLETGVLFQDTSSGGFMRRTSQTRLLKDGRLQQGTVRPDGGLTLVKTQRISVEQLQQFEQLLAACRFQQYNRLNYPATKGSADYITVTLSSPNATVRYADSIQGELPRSLQTVIKSWNQLRQSAQ